MKRIEELSMTDTIVTGNAEWFLVTAPNFYNVEEITVVVRNKKYPDGKSRIFSYRWGQRIEVK